MKTTTSTLAALLLTTTVATAGGLDRSGQPIGIIFEDGNVIELSYGQVTPTVSGNHIAAAGSFSSGNMAGSYNQVGLGVKYQFNEDISLAVIFDQPFGASVDYADADANYYTGAATADVTSSAITAVARYNINSNFSVHGGLRYQTVEASVTKPTAANYAIDSEPSSSTGYLVGVAYERPEIALRVALTYNSAITHDITATETCGAPFPTCAGTTAVTSVDTPESFNLDFQSGVAEDTLVFGSIRYAKWTQFDFAPPVHSNPNAAGGINQGSLQSYDNDTVAYSIGVGRRFSDQWSGALTVGYEGETDGFAGPLAPTNGNTSVGIGATYSMDNIEITGGVRYIWLGDADTENPTAPGSTLAEFRDNTATAIGLKIAYNF